MEQKKDDKDEGEQGGGGAPKKKPVSPETGGPKGPEPTRFGDWEINGKCVDF